MAVALQSNGVTGATAAAATVTLSFNNVSGDRVIGMGMVCVDGASPTVTGINYPNPTLAMTKIASQTGTQGEIAIFEILAAAGTITGTNNMKLTASSGANVVNVGAFSVSGSHASTASTAATGASSASAKTLAITKSTTSGNGFCAAFMCGDNTLTVTDTQVFLENVSNSHQGDNGVGGYQNASGGSDTITGNSTNNDHWLGCGMEIPAAAGGSGAGPIMNGGQIIKGIIIRGGRIIV